MKTALFSPCMLEGKDPSGSDRLERNLRYIFYYRKLQTLLGFDKTVLADNSSPIRMIDKLGNHHRDEEIQQPESHYLAFPDWETKIRGGKPDVEVWRYHRRLEGGGHLRYPYCWRALYAIGRLINQGYEKIITIDSDGFILSKRLAEYVRDCNSGWEAFWEEKHQFPTAELHILNKDCFDIYMQFTSVHWMTHMGKMMETSLPFTKVNRDFIVGRFGETRTHQHKTHDFYGQAPTDISLEFGKFA